MASVMVLIAIGLLSLLIVIPILLIIDSCQPQLQAGLSFEDVAARLGFPASLTGFSTAGGYAGGDAKYTEVIEVDPEAQLPPSPTTPPVHYRSPTVQAQRGILPTHQAPATMMQQQQKHKQLFSLPPPLPPKSSLAAMAQGKQPPTGPRPASRLANTPAKGPSDAQRKAAVLSMAKLIMLRHDKACRRQPRPRAPSPSQGHGRARSMPALAITAVTVNDSRAPPVLVA